MLVRVPDNRSTRASTLDPMVAVIVVASSRSEGSGVSRDLDRLAASGVIVTVIVVFILVIVSRGINGSKISSPPGALVEGEESPQLHQTVIVSENDVGRDQKKIAWAPPEMGQQLDHLADEDPGGHDGEDVAVAPSPGGVVQNDHQCSIVEECKVEEGCQIDCIHTPGLRVPDGAVSEERAGVAAPGGPNPT